jgi:protein TonB
MISSRSSILIGALAIAISTVVAIAQDVRDTIGPLEKSAQPSSPENPIPRRTSAPQARQPQEWQGRAGRGFVRLQATLDAAGRVAEIRKLIEPQVQIPQGATADDATRRAIAGAMLKSAADALSQWKYDAPAAPITFPVQFSFNASAEPVAIQDPPPPLSVPARGTGAPLAALPPWPAAEGAVRVGSGISAPRQIKKVNPVYPSAAQRERVQGVVILEAIIGTDGKVTDARVLRSVPLLDQAALDAVKQWEYTPTLLDGKPVPLVMTVTTNFTMDGGISQPGPWPAAAGAVRVGGNIAPPRKIKDVRAAYPLGAQADRVSGAVTLELLIGPDGKVKDVRVIRSSPAFDKSAVDAVRKWEYEPTLVNGMPVSVVMTATVTFSIR